LLNSIKPEPPGGSTENIVMNYQPSQGLQQFKNLVGIKFQLYNSLFTSLPFHRIEKTGILLSLLLTVCEEGYMKKQSPEQILEEFFRKHTSLAGEREKADILIPFRSICRAADRVVRCVGRCGIPSCQ
jgi:hypothetical protein